LNYNKVNYLEFINISLIFKIFEKINQIKDLKPSVESYQQGRNISELPAWPAAWQAPGRPPGRPPGQAGFSKFWPGLIRPFDIRPGLQARSGQSCWPGYSIILIFLIINL
jgi:hypothetical protein